MTEKVTEKTTTEHASVLFMDSSGYLSGALTGGS
jgi:hypothetical protein